LDGMGEAEDLRLFEEGGQRIALRAEECSSYAFHSSAMQQRSLRTSSHVFFASPCFSRFFPAPFLPSRRGTPWRSTLHPPCRSLVVLRFHALPFLAHPPWTSLPLPFPLFLLLPSAEQACLDNITLPILRLHPRWVPTACLDTASATMSPLPLLRSIPDKPPRLLHLEPTRLSQQKRRPVSSSSSSTPSTAQRKNSKAVEAGKGRNSVLLPLLQPCRAGGA
jgi:hypothetical protein